MYKTINKYIKTLHIFQYKNHKQKINTNKYMLKKCSENIKKTKINKHVMLKKQKTKTKINKYTIQKNSP